jgi:acetoin utilization protein AcuB
LIYKYKIGGLPVLEKRRLIGILTITDILAAFIELFGLLKESCRLDIILSEKGGTLDDVLRLIREMGGKVISVGVEALTSKKKVYYIRLEKGDLSAIVQALEDEDHKVVSILD